MSKSKDTSEQESKKISRKKEDRVYLNDLGILNALGCGKPEVKKHLLEARSPGVKSQHFPLLDRNFLVATIDSDLPAIPDNLKNFECRNNQFVLAAAREIGDEVRAAIARYGADRIAVVMGTSTSGIDETERALIRFSSVGALPEKYNYTGQEIGSISEFVARLFAIEGPAYCISTACSSSGKVFASARSLIEMDLCDAVIVGGADTLCELTLGGFSSLEAMSEDLVNPFSIHRKGINIGEASAVFLMSKEPRGVEMCGVGESSDAHHMSAPEPRGEGAYAAMVAALNDANMSAIDMDYINLHGTGTKLNDAMESQSVHFLFGENVPCSSTKPLTGHTLGAAGATEAGLCWLLLHDDDRYKVAPHCFDGELDPQLGRLWLATTSDLKNSVEKPIISIVSNSFAFGGNNVSVILRRCSHD